MSPSTEKATPIERGHIYRAKRPKEVGIPPVFDDRQVLFVSEARVQYDNPTVRSGRNYPMVARAKFEAWAGSDVTEDYPPDDWEPWPAPKARAVLSEEEVTTPSDAEGQ